jgi:hypothetical protein
MDAKRLIHRKQKNGLIPLSDETLIDKSPSNVLADVLNLGINLHGLNTASIKLQSAITKIQDRKRLQEYISDIARKWEIDANAVSNEIQFVIMLVLFPMLQDRYNSHTEARETKRELADIKTLINKIEDGSIKTFEITLKATVKGVSENVQIKSSMVVGSIYKCLKSLPDVEIKAKTKGRPKGTPALENVQMKYCAELLKKGYSSKLDINVYEFIGDIFEATGLYYDEAEFIDKLIEKQLKYESLKDYKVSSVKALLRR